MELQHCPRHFVDTGTGSICAKPSNSQPDGGNGQPPKGPYDPLNQLRVLDLSVVQDQRIVDADVLSALPVKGIPKRLTAAAIDVKPEELISTQIVSRA